MRTCSKAGARRCTGSWPRPCAITSRPSPTEPEVLAHHFTRAGLDDAAIEWWGKAGDQALRRSAFKEATAHLGKAIEMADKMAQTLSSTRRRAAIGCGFKSPTAMRDIRARLWGGGNTAAFARARELVPKPRTRQTAFQLIMGYGSALLRAASWRRCGKSSRPCCAIAKTNQDRRKPASPTALPAQRTGTREISRRHLFTSTLWRSSIRSGTVISHPFRP